MSGHYRLGFSYIGYYSDALDAPENSTLCEKIPKNSNDFWNGDSWVEVISEREISNRRYEAEVSGINIDGLNIATDDRSKLLINGAAFEATINPDYTLKWKTESGFIKLNAQQVISIARAVRSHVQACFDREAELLTHLEAGTFTEGMLEEGWPS